MQAIATKWLSPTNHRPSRIVARAEAGHVTVSWDYALDVDENHRAAALTLAEKLGWAGEWVGGAPPGAHSAGYVFVNATWARGDRHSGSHASSFHVALTESAAE